MPSVTAFALRPSRAQRSAAFALAAALFGLVFDANAGQVCLPGTGLSCGGGGYSPPPRVSVPSGGGNVGAALGAAGTLLDGLGTLLDSMPSGPAAGGCDDFESQGRQMAAEVNEQNDKSLEELHLPANYSEVTLQDSCREVQFLRWKSASGHRILDYARANAPVCPASVNGDQLARGTAEVAEVDRYLQQFTQQCQQYTAQLNNPGGAAPVSANALYGQSASCGSTITGPDMPGGGSSGCQPQGAIPVPVTAQPTTVSGAPAVARPTIAPSMPAIAQPSAPSVAAVNTPRDFIRDTVNPGARAYDLADAAQAALAGHDCARAAVLFGQAAAGATNPTDVANWGEWQRRAAGGTLAQCLQQVGSAAPNPVPASATQSGGGEDLSKCVRMTVQQNIGQFGYTIINDCNEAVSYIVHNDCERNYSAVASELVCRDVPGSLGPRGRQPTQYSYARPQLTAACNARNQCFKPAFDGSN